MPLWLELLVSLLIVYGGVLAMLAPWLRRRVRLAALRLKREEAARRKQEQ
ncbi:hypothetical protein RM533_08285 [Croceicoccus sp. F390]|uniref:Heme exporter protein D n=1 Tax=Croceicoccus esteveae TaxID=3075597 RepID=A0ABU2ZL81_9SPHN|nr:hypothetical protein [Croceicoccus sp. F390]MDT0576182.1 hypothetical protein [Croceicoccus sp. F390]